MVRDPWARPTEAVTKHRGGAGFQLHIALALVAEVVRTEYFKVETVLQGIAFRREDTSSYQVIVGEECWLAHCETIDVEGGNFRSFYTTFLSVTDHDFLILRHFVIQLTIS